MHRILIRKFLVASLSALLLFLLLPPAAAAQKPGGGKSLETMYAAVSYPDAEALLEFSRRIGRGEAALVRDNARAGEMVKEEIDRLVFRVKTLLDMHPPAFRFSIIVLETNKEITEAYRALGLGGKAPIAFYRQKSQTIYISLDKMTAGVLAHEVAHAVINAFFPTPPPAQMQEILAQYVDRHLWD